MEELDPAQWFRINRGQLLSPAAIRSVQLYFNHRLVLELAPDRGRGTVMARGRVRGVREWMGGVMARSAGPWIA